MNKCYFLLRDNKETGPYSLSELLPLSLTANDLIWVEGKSAGWRYASEMEELNVVPVITRQVQPAAIVNAKVADSNPNIRSEAPAKKIFVSLPVGASRQPVSSTPSLEEKAEALRQKALSYSENRRENTLEGRETTTVDYTRSIHDIKVEYAERKPEQKRIKKRMSAGALLGYSALFIGIAGISFFVLSRKSKREEPLVSDAVIAKKITLVPNEQSIDSAVDKVVQNIPKNSGRQTMPAPSEKAAIKNLTKFSTILQGPSVSHQANGQTPVPASKQIVPDKKEEELPITDLMETSSHYIQREEGIGLSVDLHNKSGKKIRVAAIDVLFYDKGGMQVHKETLYFSNVQPGSTITKMSAYLKAASASYRVGLVSTENAGLYVAQ